MFIRIIMKIIEFEYVSKTDRYDKRWSAWSRIYEYQFVLKFLESLGKDISIHNTGCGGGELHLDFAKELEQYGKQVIHSDIDSIWGSGKPNNYVIYDILNKPTFKTDVILCISTLEHLPFPIKAINNLLDGLNDGGYLIVTLDCPPVNIIELESFLGVKCIEVKDKLLPSNSVLPNYEFGDISIVKLIIQK